MPRMAWIFSVILQLKGGRFGVMQTRGRQHVSAPRKGEDYNGVSTKVFRRFSPLFGVMGADIVFDDGLEFVRNGIAFEGHGFFRH